MGNKTASAPQHSSPLPSTDSANDVKTTLFLYPILLVEGFVRENYSNYLNISSLIINKITKYIDPKTKIYQVTDDETTLHHLSWFEYTNDINNSLKHIDDIYTIKSSNIKHFIIHYSDRNLLWYIGGYKREHKQHGTQNWYDWVWKYNKNDTLSLSNITYMNIFDFLADDPFITNRAQEFERTASKYNNKTFVVFLDDSIKNKIGFVNIQKSNYTIKYVEGKPCFPSINAQYDYVETIQINKIFMSGDRFYILCSDGKLFEKRFSQKSGLNEVVDRNEIIFNIACYKDICIVNVVCNKYVTFINTKYGEVYYKSVTVNGRAYGLFPDHCTEFVKYKYFFQDDDDDETNNEYLRIVSMKLGDKHAIALDENGFVYIWGSNKYGQLNMEHEMNQIKEPKQLRIFEQNYMKYKSDLVDINYKNEYKNGMIKFDKIVLGNNHSFVINKKYKICYGFGDNTNNQLVLYNKSDKIIKNAIIATKMTVFEKLMRYNGRANIFAIKDETYVVVEQ